MFVKRVHVDLSSGIINWLIIAVCLGCGFGCSGSFLNDSAMGSEQSPDRSSGGTSAKAGSSQNSSGAYEPPFGADGNEVSADVASEVPSTPTDDLSSLPEQPASHHWLELSTDDSTSMASAQYYKAHRGGYLSGSPLFTHEFINYYDPPASLFGAEPWVIDESIADTLSMGVEAERVGEDGGEIEFLFQLKADAISTTMRRGWNIFLCVDVSGSMSGEKIEHVRNALVLMLQHFKAGDRVTLVTFDSTYHDVFVDADFASQEQFIRENFQSLEPGSSTNMLAGLDRSYALAQDNFQSDMTNRVLLFSDGAANVGDTDIQSFADLTRINEQEGIYLSGVGVGLNYAVERMDRLTDAGKGAHVFLPDDNEVNLIFGDYFSKLIEVAADEISIEMELPVGIHLSGFSGEEVSFNPDQRLQKVVLAAGDDLTFLARFVIDDEEALDKSLTLRVSATPLSTGQKITTEIEVAKVSDLLVDTGALAWRTRIIRDFAQVAIGESQGVAFNTQDLIDDLGAYLQTHGADSGLDEIKSLLTAP
jgi:Ca-activated chloride channel homolog